MILIKLTYIVPIEEVDKFLPLHREFLSTLYKEKRLILSGPMIPRTGGIIIAASKNLEEVKTMMAKDPYFQANIAEYEYIPFTPVMHCASLQEIVERTEGKLC